MSNDRGPGFGSTTVAYAAIRDGKYGEDLDDTVVVDASEVSDSGSTPTTRLRAGQVLIRRTSTGRYVLATDSDADAISQAQVDSVEAPDSDWTGKVITVTIDGVTVAAVTLGTITDLNSAIADLNGTEGLAGGFVQAGLFAQASSTNLGIVCKRPGPIKLGVSANLATAYGDVEVTDEANDPDVVVTKKPVDLVNEFGTAAHAVAEVARQGRFIEANLLNLTGEAKAVLRRRGSHFI